ATEVGLPVALSPVSLSPVSCLACVSPLAPSPSPSKRNEEEDNLPAAPGSHGGRPAAFFCRGPHGFKTSPRRLDRSGRQHPLQTHPRPSRAARRGDFRRLQSPAGIIQDRRPRVRYSAHL